MKKKKPFLSATHRKKRSNFASKYKEWTIEDWKRVIWSDETKINRIASYGRQWVWKKTGEGLIEREVQGTIKLGEEISWYGAVWVGRVWGDLQRLRGR